jgi:nucleoid-associated protein YgaU
MLLTLMAILAVGAWMVWQNPPPALAEMLPFMQPSASADSAGEATSSRVEGVDPNADVPPAAVVESTPTPEATSAPLLPTATPPADVVKATGQPIAATDLEIVPAAAETSTLDFKGLLMQQGRADLAALPVNARVDGTRLVLEGTVEWAEQRAALEFVGRQAPGITDVSIVNVKVKPPATYVVQEGDSLWGISVRIYGDPDQVEELFAANQDVLPTANALSVGMELKVPPVE